MYYRHFGLSGPPFQFVVAPDAIYRGREHSEAVAALEWGLLHEPTSYAMLIGQPGTGKTTLICSLLAQRADRVTAAYVNHPKMGFEDLLRLVLRQFGIDPPPPSKLDCLEAFRRYLNSNEPEHRVAIVIDEAQQMDENAFEEFRLLSNYAQLDGRQVQIVLLGQPDLYTKLQSPSLRQLNDRIGTRAVLNPLEPSEVYGYIDHRLRIRGGKADQVFARSAINQIIAHSGGIPRRINVLCHNAMLAAYSAGLRRIGNNQARMVISEYQNLMSHVRTFNPPEPKRSFKLASLIPFLRPAAAFVGLALIGLALGHLWLAAGSSPARTTAVGAAAAAQAADLRSPQTIAQENTRPIPDKTVRATHETISPTTSQASAHARRARKVQTDDDFDE